MLNQFLDMLTYGHWLALGGLLIGLEILIPGTFFLWVGISAIIVSIFVYVLGISSVTQLLTFALLAPLSAWIGRKMLKKGQIHDKPSTLNRRGAQMIGRIISLDTPLTMGEGRVTIGDSVWKISGPDLPPDFPVGSRVKIVGCEGNTLIVQSIRDKV